MQTRLSHAVLISAAVIIALDVVLAQNEWGTGAVFFVRKVTPNATDNVIRDGDYVNIRGTVGDPWWAISNGAIAGAPPNSAELLVVRKTTPKNPNNPASMDTALITATTFKCVALKATRG